MHRKASFFQVCKYLLSFINVNFPREMCSAHQSLAQSLCGMCSHPYKKTQTLFQSISVAFYKQNVISVLLSAQPKYCLSLPCCYSLAVALLTDTHSWFLRTRPSET